MLRFFRTIDLERLRYVAWRQRPVATWYSSGWNRWKLRRSTSVTATDRLRARFFAAYRPANPPPTITTWWGWGAMATRYLSRSAALLSAAWAAARRATGTRNGEHDT